MRSPIVDQHLDLRRGRTVFLWLLSSNMYRRVLWTLELTISSQRQLKVCGCVCACVCVCVDSFYIIQR